MVLATRASLTQSIRSVFAGARICPRPGSAVRPFVKAPDTMLKRRKLEAPESPTHALIDDAEVILSHSLGDSFKVPGLVCTDHQFTVPLDHSGEVEGELDLFVREVVTPNNVNRRDLPYLLYLQGGPGFESPRPTESSGWIKSATASFRVILMDQRGTGRSGQVTVRNLQRLGAPEKQAQHLAFLRADSIVRDAEIVRKALVPRDNHGGRWSLLGQSFGGFCCMTYLSIAPEGLLEVMITGGIPPGIDQPCSAEAAYRACFRRVLQSNQRYYTRFPGDVKAVQRIVGYLASQPEGGVRLRNGTLLTPRALQLLGLHGLGSGGGFQRLHYLLESFFDAATGEMNPSFERGFESWMSWETNPLYALLHESIYCQGAASAWSAQRVLDTTPELKAAFDAVGASVSGRPVMLLGEMVFPWFFDDFAALRPYKAVADLLAAKADWPALYSKEALRGNKVPVAAVTYAEDMYVAYDLAQETAGHVQGIRQWITNELKHSGLRDDGSRVFERALNMVRDALLQE